MDVVIVLLAVCGGWLVGILINVLADDLPLRQNPRLPHYPNGAPRPLIAWSGLLAFLTGQRNGPEIWFTPEEEKNLTLEEIAHYAYDTTLSWRHPLTEMGMAALFGGLAAFAGDEARLPLWLIFLSILALITIIDLEHRLILFIVIIPSVIVTFILNALFPEEAPTGTRAFTEYIIGAVLGGGVFFLMYLGGGVFADAVAAMRGRSLSEVAFGFGDVMLAFLCGAMISWRAMIFAMFITVFAGAIGAIGYMLWRLVAGRRYSLYTVLPYGPYIVFGTVVMMLFIEPIRAYFGTQ